MSLGFLVAGTRKEVGRPRATPTPSLVPKGDLVLLVLALKCTGPLCRPSYFGSCGEVVRPFRRLRWRFFGHGRSRVSGRGLACSQSQKLAQVKPDQIRRTVNECTRALERIATFSFVVYQLVDLELITMIQGTGLIAPCESHLETHRLSSSMCNHCMVQRTAQR